MSILRKKGIFYTEHEDGEDSDVLLKIEMRVKMGKIKKVGGD